MMLGVAGGAPRQGGRGKTFCVPAVLSCDTHPMHFLFTDQLVELGYVWRLLQKDDPYNRHEECLLRFQFLRMKGATPFIPMIGSRAETGRTQSGTLLRNEVKQMRGATGLTVLALILACVAALRGYLRAY